MYIYNLWYESSNAYVSCLKPNCCLRFKDTLMQMIYIYIYIYIYTYISLYATILGLAFQDDRASK